MVERQDKAERIVENFFGDEFLEVEFLAMLNGPETVDAGPIEVVDKVIESVVELGVAGHPGAIDDFAGEPEELVDMSTVPVVGGEFFDKMDGDGEDVGIREVVIVIEVVCKIVGDAHSVGPERTAIATHDFFLDLLVGGRSEID